DLAEALPGERLGTAAERFENFSRAGRKERGEIGKGRLGLAHGRPGRGDIRAPRKLHQCRNGEFGNPDVEAHEGGDGWSAERFGAAAGIYEHAIRFRPTVNFPAARLP